MRRTLLLSSSLRQGSTIFNAVFFVVVASTLFQGTTLKPPSQQPELEDVFARWRQRV